MQSLEGDATRLGKVALKMLSAQRGTFERAVHGLEVELAQVNRTLSLRDGSFKRTANKLRHRYFELIRDEAYQCRGPAIFGLCPADVGITSSWMEERFATLKEILRERTGMKLSFGVVAALLFTTFAILVSVPSAREETKDRREADRNVSNDSTRNVPATNSPCVGLGITSEVRREARTTLPTRRAPSPRDKRPMIPQRHRQSSPVADSELYQDTWCDNMAKTVPCVAENEIPVQSEEVFKKYLWIPIKIASFPVVTRLTMSYNEDGIQIEWHKVDEETARLFLEQHRAELDRVMKATGIEGSVEATLEDLFADLGNTRTHCGRHEYYPATGDYIYQQKVVLSSEMANFIAGVIDVEAPSAALKIAYSVLGEPELAGPANVRGREVRAMTGRTLVPGR